VDTANAGFFKNGIRNPDFYEEKAEINSKNLK